MPEAEVTPKAEVLAHLGPLPFTNSQLTMLVVMGILVVFAILTTRRMLLVPGRTQSFLEVVVEFLLGMVEGMAGKRTGRAIFPLVATLFIFIITANWFGLFPGFGTIGLIESKEGHSVLVPFLRAANADYNMTIAMALIAVVVVQVAGIVSHGVGGYLKELATPAFLLPVHVISEFSRIISLSSRLFGNIFGGEVLVMVMFKLVPLVVPVVFMGLEMLFGFIQALIFSVLTLVYISLAAAGHGGHEEQPAGHH